MEKKINKFLLIILSISCVIILILFFFAATYPPHLPQEYDFINYIGTLPKQHDLRGSWWTHIQWSAADLWPQAIQWVLWPLWKLFPPGNRLPQFFLALGSWIFATLILKKRGFKFFDGFFLLTIFFFGHGILIQWGTAQLDLPMTFFWVLILTGIYRTNPWLVGLGAGMIAGSKTFNIAYVFTILLPFIIIFRRWMLKWKNLGIMAFLIALIAGPFYVRSLYYSGTPFFPVKPCLFSFGYCEDMQKKEILIGTSKEQHKTLYHYGEHSILGFIKAILFLPFPDPGKVNNTYDYPLGFVWIFYIIILFYWAKNISHMDSWSKACIVSSLLLFLLWFLSSQQSRWLYPSLLLAMLSLSAKIMERNHSYFFILIFFHIVLASVMIKNSHGYIFTKSRWDVLTDKQMEDWNLIGRKSIKRNGMQLTDFYYINSQVIVEEGPSYWIFNGFEKSQEKTD